jgi:hypothetical protein
MKANTKYQNDQITEDNPIIYSFDIVWRVDDLKNIVFESEITACDLDDAPRRRTDNGKQPQLPIYDTRWKMLTYLQKHILCV